MHHFAWNANDRSGSGNRRIRAAWKTVSTRPLKYSFQLPAFTRPPLLVRLQLLPRASGASDSCPPILLSWKRNPYKTAIQCLPWLTQDGPPQPFFGTLSAVSCCLSNLPGAHLRAKGAKKREPKLIQIQSTARFSIRLPLPAEGSCSLPAFHWPGTYRLIHFVRVNELSTRIHKRIQLSTSSSFLLPARQVLFQWLSRHLPRQMVLGHGNLGNVSRSLLSPWDGLQRQVAAGYGPPWAKFGNFIFLIGCGQHYLQWLYGDEITCQPPAQVHSADGLQWVEINSTVRNVLQYDLCKFDLTNYDGHYQQTITIRTPSAEGL